MIDYMQYQHASLLDARLDDGRYSDADLISIKTPLSLPYFTGSPDFERVQGSIEIEGVTYEYVKRRVHRDTLEILCLPNRGKMQLQSAAVEFFKRSLDGTTSPHEKQPTTIKISLPDYCQEIRSFSLERITLLINKHYLAHSAALSAGYPSKGEHPPESMRCFG